MVGKKQKKKTLKIILNFLTIQQDSNLPLQDFECFIVDETLT